METTQHETELITTRVESGILIVKIELNSLMHEMVISQVESSIMEVLPRAKTSILIDCSELQLHVSSQFLSSLMCVYRNANARGTKLAVCNLSSTLKAGYEVTALTTLIPAYDSTEQAIKELEKLQVREIVRPDSRREPHPRLAAEPIQLSWTAAALLVFAFLFFCSVAFMLGTIMSAASPQGNLPAAARLVPFETAITGTITSVEGAADAWVIAWPVGYRPRTALKQADFARLSRTSSDWSSMISVTETSRDGTFELPVRGFGSKAEINVLIVANNLAGSRENATVDLEALAGVVDDPKTFLAGRRYQLMNDVVIRPQAVTDYRWRL